MKSMFRLSPFAWSEKGESISQAGIEITRCNYCGAWGWEYLQGETLYEFNRPEDEGLTDQPGKPEQPLRHADGCPNR